YESRPDVTIEAAASAFFSSNRILLKGGKEARNTNLALIDGWKWSLQQHGVDQDWVQYLDLSREEMATWMQQHERSLDLIIPRGGQALIDHLKQSSSVPLLVSGRGNNFLYIHDDAQMDMAIALVRNGKSRLSVCNATDKVLIHRNWPIKALQKLIDECVSTGLELVTLNPQMAKNCSSLYLASNQNLWEEEFLSAKLQLEWVDSSNEAIDLINHHSGKHTAVIVCEAIETATHFQQQADVACVIHNASSRFTDGGQVGLGAEIAISTQKTHARGPVGPQHLVTNKWFISGGGQIRE
ncbi:glutamate-5-semialdehyde dehydrogenase, partial [Arthrospira platensis SPKY1]|nr:glutamate-5-semialdehyde dehydrogenase [Arthrospira platensis SPKY1]